MALVGEAGLLCDQSKGLVGLAQQGFCAREPALDDIALRPDARRLLEGAAEVIGAQTGHSCEFGQGQPIIEMCLDEVAHALQALRREALAGRQREMPDKTLSDADTQGSAQAFDQDPVGDLRPPPPTS
jgi:hypothetical protein